jgi:hypothetical protein
MSRPPNSEGSATGHRPAQRPCDDGPMVARPLPRSRPRSAFNGVKVFSATKFADRNLLGDRVTLWLREHPEFPHQCLTVTNHSWNVGGISCGSGAGSPPG